MEKVENVFFQVNVTERVLAENAQVELISNVVWEKPVKGVPKVVQIVEKPQAYISVHAEGVVEHALTLIVLVVILILFQGNAQVEQVLNAV
jgi:hypothetical protein